jgi:hypothetical protein
MGGMAETFEAIRRGPSGFTQRVCLKLVLPFFRDDEDFLMLFEREAKLAAKLRHSNIVGVIDFGQIDGTSYMALELVDGADLQVVLDAQDGKRLSHDYVALLGHELAAALDHAHNPPRESGFEGASVNAIVHRDISPSNILISCRGEILLTDFGVAKAVTGQSRKQSAVKGKIPYMSPEQLRAESVDGRADLFALGVVLFEALAGQLPYEGAHDPATIMLILQGDHPSLHKLAPGAPPELCRVIESLIEPDRDKRPENASALVDLLDEFVPPPRTKRQLGEMATAVRPEQVSLTDEELLALGESDTAAQGDARPGDREKSASGVVDAGEADRSEPKPRAGGRWSRRDLRRALAGSLLAIAGLAAGGFAWWFVATQPAAPVEAVAEEDTRDENDLEGAAEEQSSAEARPAKLTVVVFPRGDVWINGRLRGAAPLRNESLKPGRYKIGVGQGRPSETQTVDLRAGQRKTILFDLGKRSKPNDDLRRTPRRSPSGR